MLFYIEDQALQVFALGVVDVDWMVSGLGELVEDADLAPCLSGSAEHGQPELFLADGLGAGKSEQDAARGDFLKSLGIEAAVTHQGVTQRALVLGKCRRVKDDEVIALPLHGQLPVGSGAIGESFARRRAKARGGLLIGAVIFLLHSASWLLGMNQGCEKRISTSLQR